MPQELPGKFTETLSTTTYPGFVVVVGSLAIWVGPMVGILGIYVQAFGRVCLIKIQSHTVDRRNPFRTTVQKPWFRLIPQGKHQQILRFGCGSQLNRRGCAGCGPCFELPGFHVGILFLLSHSHFSHGFLISCGCSTPLRRVSWVRNSVEDLEQQLPGVVSGVREWFRWPLDQLAVWSFPPWF